jgi:hypothetical protein
MADYAHANPPYVLVAYRAEVPDEFFNGVMMQLCR